MYFIVDVNLPKKEFKCMDKNNMADRIRSLREENGLSLSEFGKRLEVTKSAIHAYEIGLNVPTLPVLYRMADEFHVSIDYLVGINNKNSLDIGHLTEKQRQFVRQMVGYLGTVKE